MKIEIVEKIYKASYYEILCMTLNYYKVRKNPHKKINFIIPLLKLLFVYAFGMLFFIILYAVKQKSLNIYTYIIQTFIKGFLFLILFLFYFNVLLKKSVKSKSSIILDDMLISQKVNDKITAKIKWDDLKSIIISKHSICIIPNSAKLKLIGLDISYKEEFINAVYQFNKQSLIIDNSNLY